MVAATAKRTVFDFDEDCQVECYDEWPFYQKRLLPSAGPKQVKGCDLVVISQKTLFLIEVKDYTHPPGTTSPQGPGPRHSGQCQGPTYAGRPLRSREV